MSGKRASNFRSHVLGLRLRKVAQVTGSFAERRPVGAKEMDVLGLRLRKVAQVTGSFAEKRPMGDKECVRSLQWHPAGAKKDYCVSR